VLCALPEVEIPLPSIAPVLSTRTSHSLSQHSSIQFIKTTGFGGKENKQTNKQIN